MDSSQDVTSGVTLICRRTERPWDGRPICFRNSRFARTPIGSFFSIMMTFPLLPLSLVDGGSIPGPILSAVFVSSGPMLDVGPLAGLSSLLWMPLIKPMPLAPILRLAAFDAVLSRTPEMIFRQRCTTPDTETHFVFIQAAALSL